MKKIKLKILTLLLILPALCLTLSSFIGTGGYKVGDKAINFELKNIDGKLVSPLKIPEAKGFIIIFTCNHCPFAVAYEDRIINLHKKYSPLGYPVIAINPNDETSVPADSYENMIVRAKEKNFPFAYLRDETQEVAKAYGALKTPHVYIVQKSGSDLFVKYIGAIDDNTDEPANVKTKYVENAMDEILSGKTVSQNTTKAIGCSVKYKQ